MTKNIDDILKELQDSNTNLGLNEDLLKKLAGYDSVTVGGSTFVDAIIKEHTGTDFIITYLHAHTSAVAACEWRVQLDDNGAKQNLIEPIINATGSTYTNCNIRFGTNQDLYANEVSGTETLYYVYTYYYTD